MIMRNSLLRAYVAKHIQLLLIFSAHAFFLSGWLWKQESFLVLGSLRQKDDNVPSVSRRLIPMRLSTQIPLVLLVLALILVCALPALAGALPPCVKAVSSNNGNFLVISDAQLEPEQGNISRVQQVSLQVFPKENFINTKDRVASPATYWANWVQWRVVLDSSNSRPVPGCPLSLITDDGEFLIVLNVHATDSALRIYRRRDHIGDPVREGPNHGVFIRDITLREIWPADKLADVQIVTDETPQWFAGGAFEFSTDCRLLIHKTRWGNTVRINLRDGSVSRN
jgi:hypothetical protein